MAVNAAPLSQKDEVSALKDKLRIMQKYGTHLSDEQIAERIELEERAARHKEENLLNIERRKADRAQIESENRRIASAELGKRIIVSINKTRIETLNPDCGIPCPECGGNVGHATLALMEIADLIRSYGKNHMYDLIDTMCHGAKNEGIPCIHTGGSCAHCGAGVDVLVQLVI